MASSLGKQLHGMTNNYLTHSYMGNTQTTSESAALTSSSNVSFNPIYSTSLPAMSGESLSGTTPRLPDPRTTENEQFCLAYTDIQRVAEAMAHIIGSSPATQSQPNPITVGLSHVRTPQSSSEGQQIRLPEVQQGHGVAMRPSLLILLLTIIFITCDLCFCMYAGRSRSGQIA